MTLIQSTKWDFETRRHLTLDVLMGRMTFAEAARQFKTEPTTIKQIIEEIITLPKFNPQTNNMIFKNTDSVYIDHNTKAEELGSRQEARQKKYMTDYDSCPEFADYYVAGDQYAIKNKTTYRCFAKVVHEGFGVIDAYADVVPMFNDHHDVEGVLIIGSIDLDITKQSFPTVVRNLQQGYARHYIHQESITIFHQGDNIVLHQREIELLLYLTVGLSAKEILMCQHFSGQRFN